jgi:glycosyltransferase involved in cell wall biosynthesis
MSSDENPMLSIVIPTLNGETRLPHCLQSILDQDFPRESIQIVVVDDESSDRTLEVCEQFGVNKVLISGKRNIEYSKAMGARAVDSKYILFIDDDNVLQDDFWISRGIEVLENDLHLNSFSPAYFDYDPKQNFVNRYNALFGTNDPVVYLMKRCDKLPLFRDLESFLGKSKKFSYVNSFTVSLEFEEDKLPTLGSNGFLTRTKLVQTFLVGDRFYHLDFVRFICNSDTPKFAMSNVRTGHMHADNLMTFVRKCRRNVNLYLRDKYLGDWKREYDYRVSFLGYLLVAIKAVTIAQPLYHSIRGYQRVRDVAWFLHPFLCWIITVVYAWELLVFLPKVLSNRLKRANVFGVN